MKIVCATDGNYLPHCAIMLQSLLRHAANPQDLQVYLIIDNVSSEQFNRVIPYLHSLLPSLSILRVDPACLGFFPVFGHATVATYFRLLLPGVLPAELKRVLFIDADTVVTANLEPLWNLSLEGKALGAVPDHWLSCQEQDHPVGSYFNAGVLLIDLERWRQADVLERGGAFARAHPEALRYWDQDVLNHVFQHDWLPIGHRWNACPHLFGLLPDFSLDSQHLSASEQEAIADPAIIHFAGGGGRVKPWNAHCIHPRRHHYLEARALTPWGDEPLDDAPPSRWRQIWDDTLFRAKCRARRLLAPS
ncbi:MAG: glycosyltransferase family 8 protein [Cyanobacteriota bacterium]